MSRALELFSVVTCCFHVVVPARLPQMSDWTRLSPLHSRTHSCHCVTFVDVALLFISRCLPALLVLAFYETFQNIAFILLLLSLSLSFVTTFLMFCFSLLCWWILPLRFLHCSLLRGDGGVVVGFVFVPALCIGVIPGGCFAWSPKEFD